MFYFIYLNIGFNNHCVICDHKEAAKSLTSSLGSSSLLPHLNHLKAFVLSREILFQRGHNWMIRQLLWRSERKFLTFRRVDNFPDFLDFHENRELMIFPGL